MIMTILKIDRIPTSSSTVPRVEDYWGLTKNDEPSHVQPKGSPMAILKIDRTSVFDPIPFFHKSIFDRDTTIVRQDDRSLKFEEFDPSNIIFKKMLEDGESRVSNEEKLSRLIASGDIPLDAKVFEALWKNKALIPETWKSKIKGETIFIFFYGTILRASSTGIDFVIYLFFDDNVGLWRYEGASLDDRYRSDTGMVAAVLAS